MECPPRGAGAEDLALLTKSWALFRRYETLLIIALHLTTVFLNWHIVVGVLPRYALEFGVSLAAAGLLISAFTAARILLNFPAGVLTDRIGRRPLLLGGGVLCALGSLGSGLVPGFNELIVMRFLCGAGGAIAITAQQTIMADLSTRQNRARLMSFNEGIIGIGVALGPAVGGLVAAAYGLRVPFLVAGLGTLLVTIWALLRLPETRGMNAEGAPAKSGEVGVWAGLGTILRDRNYVMIALVGFGTFFTRFGTLFLLLPLLAYSDKIGLSLSEFGLMASAVAGAQALLLPAAGFIADRFGRKALIVPSTVLTGLALVAYGLAPSREWFLVAAGFYAISSGINGPAPGAYLADVAPAHLRGISMGTYRTFGDLAGLIAPIILGIVASTTPNPGLAVAGNGVLVVAMGLAFAALAAETHHRQAPAPLSSTTVQEPRPAAG